MPIPHKRKVELGLPDKRLTSLFAGISFLAVEVMSGPEASMSSLSGKKIPSIFHWNSVFT